ncbi:11447_t:CDS:2, partial [Diversispora eburnea]
MARLKYSLKSAQDLAEEHEKTRLYGQVQDQLDECREECYQIRESLEGGHEDISEGEFAYDELKQKLRILGLIHITWQACNLRQAQILNVEFNTSRIAWRNQRDRNWHIAQKLQNSDMAALRGRTIAQMVTSNSFRNPSITHDYANVGGNNTVT